MKQLISDRITLFWALNRSNSTARHKKTYVTNFKLQIYFPFLQNLCSTCICLQHIWIHVTTVYVWYICIKYRRVLTVKTFSGCPLALQLVSWTCFRIIHASSCLAFCSSYMKTQKRIKQDSCLVCRAHMDWSGLECVRDVLISKRYHGSLQNRPTVNISAVTPPEGSGDSLAWR